MDRAATERELWAAYAASRSVPDRNRLVEFYLPLLDRIAWLMHKRFAGRLSPGEFASDGTSGLIRAVERFDPARGWRFETYATTRIRGAMLDAVRDRDYLSRLDRRRATAGEFVPPAVGALEALCITNTDGSVSRFHPVDEPGYSALDDDDWWQDECRGEGPRERRIVELYYRRGWTMRRIGRSLGLSESRVSQMHSAILDRMRERRGVTNLPSPVADEVQQETPAMDASTLIKQIATLDPDDVRQQIAAAEQERDAFVAAKADEIAILQRLLAMLTGEKIKTKMSRRPRRSTDSPSDNGQPATSAAVPSVEIDRSIPLERRVETFLRAAGPSSFRAVHINCGGSPVELSNALANSRKFVRSDDDKLWSLKHAG